MQTILWLDDESMSISFERDILLPDELHDIDLKIITFEKINELMEYISCNLIEDSDIFIIDIMLISEEEIILEDSRSISISNDLMAGVTLYIEFLADMFPENSIVLYTSREHTGNIFDYITSDSRYGVSLFLVDKWKKDTQFISVIKKIVEGNRV